jgi:hypothetical protein
MTRLRVLAAAAALTAVAAFQLFPLTGANAQGEAAGWGTIKGQVVLAGPVPMQQEVAAVKTHQDAKNCLKDGPVVKQDWVVNAKNKGVEWTFVWLQPDKAKGQTELPINPALKEIKQKEVMMDQPCCTFIPHAIGMRQGQVLVAKNSAPMPHNYKYGGNPAKNPGNNVLIPPGGKLEIKDLVADRFPVSISCTIHPWMQAWVRVYDHPYYAVTDKDGNFEIKDAPAGTYNLVVWHESVGWGTKGGKNGDPVTIKAGAVTELPKIELTPGK